MSNVRQNQWNNNKQRKLLFKSKQKQDFAIFYQSNNHIDTHYINNQDINSKIHKIFDQSFVEAKRKHRIKQNIPKYEIPSSNTTKKLQKTPKCQPHPYIIFKQCSQVPNHLSNPIQLNSSRYNQVQNAYENAQTKNIPKTNIKNQAQIKFLKTDYIHDFSTNDKGLFQQNICYKIRKIKENVSLRTYTINGGRITGVANQAKQLLKPQLIQHQQHPIFSSNQVSSRLNQKNKIFKSKSNNKIPFRYEKQPQNVNKKDLAESSNQKQQVSIHKQNKSCSKINILNSPIQVINNKKSTSIRSFLWQNQRIHHKNKQKSIKYNKSISRFIDVKPNHNTSVVVYQGKRNRINVFHNSIVLRDIDTKTNSIKDGKANYITQKDHIMVPHQLGINKVDIKQKNKIDFQHSIIKSQKVLKLDKSSLSKKTITKEAVPRIRYLKQGRTQQVQPWQTNPQTHIQTNPFPSKTIY